MAEMKKEPNKLISLFLADLAGGAERTMVNLANGIAQRGWIVHLVLAKKKGVYFEEVNPNVKIILETLPKWQKRFLMA
jgi:hypothetical protein